MFKKNISLKRKRESVDSGPALEEHERLSPPDIALMYIGSKFYDFVCTVLYNNKLNIEYIDIDHDTIYIYSKNNSEEYIAEIVYQNISNVEYYLDYNVNQSFRENGLAKLLFLLAFSLPQNLNLDKEKISFSGYLVNSNLCAFYDNLYEPYHQNMKKPDYECDKSMSLFFSTVKPNSRQLLLAFKDTPHYKIMSFLGFKLDSFKYFDVEPGNRHIGCYFKPPLGFDWSHLVLRY